MPEQRLTVLATADYYIPSKNGGGLVSSLDNAVKRMDDCIKFNIITRDRDLGEKTAFDEIQPNCWSRCGEAEVYYTSPEKLSIFCMWKLLASTSYDVLYLNSVFSIPFTIKVLLIRRLSNSRDVPVILAPRGELSAGALSIKNRKKHLFLFFAGIIRLYTGITWQASSEYEATDIKKVMGNDANVMVVPDVPPVSLSEKNYVRNPKKIGVLMIVTVSRVAKVKNIDYAIRLLRGLRGTIVFDIYGPKEDKEYLLICEEAAKKLPDNIRVNFKGLILHEQTISSMTQYDLFLMPSLGENFGHAILEALLAGCPVLISDNTPWRNLVDKGVGWDIPLDRDDSYKSVLQKLVDMDEAEHSMLVKCAFKFGRDFSNNKELLEKNKKLFYDLYLNKTSL